MPRWIIVIPFALALACSGKNNTSSAFKPPKPESGTPETTRGGDAGQAQSFSSSTLPDGVGVSFIGIDQKEIPPLKVVSLPKVPKEVPIGRVLKELGPTYIVYVDRKSIGGWLKLDLPFNRVPGITDPIDLRKFVPTVLEVRPDRLLELTPTLDEARARLTVYFQEFDPMGGEERLNGVFSHRKTLAIVARDVGAYRDACVASGGGFFVVGYCGCPPRSKWDMFRESCTTVPPTVSAVSGMWELLTANTGGDGGQIAGGARKN